MGFLRKSIIIGTGGLAPIKGRSYRERTAKAAEKQVRLQEQALRGGVATPGAPRATVEGSTGQRFFDESGSKTFRIACAYCGRKVWMPKGHGITCPNCHEAMAVVQQGGIPGIRPIRAHRRD
jgi:hypothetical protein